MKPYVESLVRDRIPHQQIDLFCSLSTLLNNIGLTGHEDELQQVAGMADGICDSSLLVARTHDVLYKGGLSVLGQYGITVDDQTPLSMIYYVLDGVSQLENYMLSDEIIDILMTRDDDEDPQDNNDILATIIYMINGTSPVESIDYIEDVRDETLNRIQLIFNERQQSMPVDEPVRHDEAMEKKQLINELRRRFARPEIVFDLSLMGKPLGCPLRDYFTESTHDELLAHQDHARQLIIELTGLILYSDITIGETGRELIKELEELADGDFQQRLYKKEARYVISQILPNQINTMRT